MKNTTNYVANKGNTKQSGIKRQYLKQHLQTIEYKVASLAILKVPVCHNYNEQLTLAIHHSFLAKEIYITR